MRLRRPWTTSLVHGADRTGVGSGLAGALWFATLAQVGFSFGLGALDGLTVLGYFSEYLVPMAAGALAFASVGVLIVTRQHGNAMGWLFCVLGLGFGSGWMTEYARLGLVVVPGGLPGAELVNWVNRWLWMPLLALLVVYLPLLFPTGRLMGPRWRVVAWLAALAATAMAVNFAIEPGRVDASQADVPNSFSPDWAPTVLPLLRPLAMVLAAASLVGGVSAAVVRYRRAREIERHQLKWFAYAVGVLVVALVGPLLVGFPRATDNTLLSGVALSIGLPAIPLATGVAILRYRLFDIDQLISRTLVYAVLTACVIGLYTFTVGYLGSLLRSADSSWISLAASGVVAVVFQPLREQVQRAVTRLLYGQRDEPYAVLSRLDRRMADSLTTETVLPTMVTEIRDALRLSSVAISLADGDEETLTALAGEPCGEEMALPLVFQGEHVGTLRLGGRAPGEALTAGDARFVEQLARHAGAAVHAVRLTTQLRRSRERLVLTREEERRRLRRDLHDELAPTLAGLGLVAASVDRLIPTDPTRAQEVARTLHDAIRRATGDIRRVAHDLRPPTLDELGLVEALRERAAQYSAPGTTHEGSTPHIRVEVREALPPLPAAVEVAAYRIVLEAMLNVIRHARAQACVVRLESVDQQRVLQVEICDDGIGLPDGGPSAGIGLRSIRERTEELNGECRFERVESSPGGTRVVARLPLGLPG